MSKKPNATIEAPDTPDNEALRREMAERTAMLNGHPGAPEPEAVEPDPPANGVATDQAAPPPEPEKPKPSEEARKLAKVIRQNREVSLLHGAYLVAQENAKETKKAWEAAATQLQGLIRGFEDRGTLPFPDDDLDEALAEKEVDGPTLHEPWRDTDIDVLTNHGLTENIADKLREAGIETIGDIANWTGGSAVTKPFLLTDIEGIGAVKAEKIEKALEGFWAAQATEHVEIIDAEANGKP